MKFNFNIKSASATFNPEGKLISKSPQEYYWNLKSKGQIVADGGGYDQLRYLIKTLKSIFKESPARMKEIEREAKRLGYVISPTIKRIEKK